ncbi:hypothetical protein BCR35DRAFT_299010 [Leucosporidium creatinivorum]|uniref:AB hydrolase-1 domain-containing protein n=1 Tax=Leucosporidium creatinivorum TaxID=106004 RepID=A0A1Y2G6U5_9BASI|nr:hypothetical protein BCR35DRAFT_299010 [Leucosporidium creatinivorum]
MSQSKAGLPSRPSYFDLYPERKPKASGSAASSSPAATAPNGKQKDPPGSSTHNIFNRSSRSGSISAFVNVTGKDKEREREGGDGPAPVQSRRPSASSSLFAKAFGSSSSSDAKMEAALGLRRGSASGMGGARRGSATSIASSSSSSSRSASKSRYPPASPHQRPSSMRQQTPIASSSSSTFPSPRHSPQASTSSSPVFPPVATLPGTSTEPSVSPPPRRGSLTQNRRSQRAPSVSNFSNDIFPSKPRPSSQSSSQSSALSHTFPPPPLNRSQSASTFGTTSSNHTSPLDFDSALDALFDSQDRSERPPSLLSKPSRSSFGGRPISNVFPSRPGSSIGARSIRTFESASSLRSTSVRRSSLDSIESDDGAAAFSAQEKGKGKEVFPSAESAGALRPPVAEMAAEPDLFAGPGETKLEFDEASGTYKSASTAGSAREAGANGSEGGMDALVASMNGLGRRRKSGMNLKKTAKVEEEERQARAREISASTIASEGSFASMTAGPTPGQISTYGGAGGAYSAPRMDRDANATLRPDSAMTDQQMRIPSAPSIDDIIRAHNASEEPAGPAPPRRTSWGRISPPGVDGAEATPLGPAVSAVPLVPTTPRSSSSTAPPPPSFFSTALPPLRYSSGASIRSNSPPRQREVTLPPPLPTSRKGSSTVEPLPVEFTPPPISDPVFPSQPTRIKTIDEIIREHGGKPSASKKEEQTPAQVLAAAARSREDSVPTSSEGEPRSSVDSVTAEIEANLLLQKTLEREAEAEADKQSGRKGSRGSLGKSFSLRLPRSSSSTALPLSDGNWDDKADTRSIKSTKSSHSTHVTPRAASPVSFAPEALAIERELATLLKSSRLTRILTLRQSPNQGLNVSLADVGSPTGHPVIVFLGLGCVRYLVALYEEMAEAFGLRLICLDRWGLGRTGEVPDDRRGFIEWSCVVEEVAEQLQLSNYSLLAHSAGAPYALATSLRSPQKIHGSIHLLAPWVSTSADSLAGAYKYLKYVPSGVIKTAQAAEWKMQAWRLGKPPTITHAPIGYDHKAGLLSTEQLSPAQLKAEAKAAREEAFDAMDVMSIMSGDVDKMSEMRLGGATKVGGVNGRPTLKPKGSKSFLGGLFGAGGSPSERSPKSSDGSDANSLKAPSTAGRRSSYYASSSLSTPPPSNRLSTAGSTLAPRVASPTGYPPPTRRASVMSTSSVGSNSTPTRRDSLTSSLTSPVSPINGNPSTPPPQPTLSSVTLSGTDLANGLLRASYAESLRGGTSDLMVILERTSKPWGFKYSDVERRVKVWHGDKDERISMSSVKGLEEEMRECRVKVVEGADHSLMTNGRVMIDVLESIAAEWKD